MKARSLAVVLFAAVGLFAIVKAIEYAQVSLGLIISVFRPLFIEGHLTWFIGMAALASVLPIILFIVGFTLLRRHPKRFLARLKAEENSEDGSEVTFSAMIILRAGLVLIGVLVLSGAIPSLIHGFFSIAIRFTSEFFQEDSSSRIWQWIQLPLLLTAAIRIALGIYLLCGAPKLLKWMCKSVGLPAQAVKPKIVAENQDFGD